MFGSHIPIALSKVLAAVVAEEHAPFDELQGAVFVAGFLLVDRQGRVPRDRNLEKMRWIWKLFGIR
jgi:hypothetical protein